MPVVVIDNGPPNPTNSNSASFSFRSTEPGSGFQCQLDGGTFSSCTSPKDYSSLAAGSHIFRVRGTDSTGNPNSRPVAYNWVIDLTPPDTVIDSGPSNPTEHSHAQFTFRSTENRSSFQCQLDGEGYSDCASPKSYSTLAAGAHTFNVKATDSLGNADASAASYVKLEVP